MDIASHTGFDSNLIQDRYELVSVIGNGGMGNVYLARDTLLDNKVIALKIIHKEFLDDPELVGDFLKEVNILQSLNNANVIRIFDISKFNEHYYYTMEYIEGPTLYELISDNALELEDVLDISIQILKGLEAIHGMGIIHSDLKPSNILISNNKTVKIADFGIARPASTGKTLHRDIVGTVEYLPPEVCVGEEVSIASDFYSLGIMIYQMLSGKLPYQYKNQVSLFWKHVNETPPSLSSLSIGVPDWFSDLVEQMLQKDPNKRPRSDREVIRYLRKHYYNISDSECLDVGDVNIEHSDVENSHILDSQVFEIRAGSKIFSSQVFKGVDRVKKTKSYLSILLASLNIMFFALVFVFSLLLYKIFANDNIVNLLINKEHQKYFFSEPKFSYSKNSLNNKKPEAITKPNLTTEKKLKMTAIRTIKQPEGLWENLNGQLFLRDVYLDIKNFGEEEATGISVKIKTPDQKILLLTGPATLSKNTKARYSTNANMLITKYGELKVMLDCSNCY